MTDLKPVPAALVARQFWKKSRSEEFPATMLHLIKWTFLAHGWGYPVLGRKFVHDPVEAWQYGPVFPELYSLLKPFGKEPVEFVPHCFEEQKQIKGIGNTKIRFNLEEKEEELISDIYNAYHHLSGGALINLTHRKGSPWDQFKFKVNNVNRKIKQKTIKKYYESLSE